MEEPFENLQKWKPGDSVYQTLCILLAEPNLAEFNSLLDQFIQNWKVQEPTFIQYFQSFYQKRPGKYRLVNGVIHVPHGQHDTMSVLHGQYMTYLHYIIEKWAKCHRYFPHADTDTNMYLEGIKTHWLALVEMYLYVQYSFHNKLKTTYLKGNISIYRRV